MSRRDVEQRVVATPRRARARQLDAATAGVEGNSRLTGATAAILLVLLAIEGVTVLQVRSLLTPHVFIGMVLVPVIAVKMGSTMYRFARYYSGTPAYRRKGPPAPLLRLLGPMVIILTVALFASGIAALFTSGSFRQNLMFLHRASFVLWFGVMAIHVLGHLKDTVQLAPRDLYWRTRRQVRGAGVRQWLVTLSVVVGVLLGWAMIGRVGPFLNG